MFRCDSYKKQKEEAEGRSIAPRSILDEVRRPFLAADIDQNPRITLGTVDQISHQRHT